MILLVLSGLAGAATLPLWNLEWRSGLLSGWALGILMETLLLGRRLAALRGGPRAGNLLALTALGFLAKLALLAAGGILGAFTGWFHAPSFLLAFLAAVFLGEGLALTRFLREGARPPHPSVRETPR
ncbi:MAG: hypothetical protein ACE5H3_00325 [Planctomycetota bacterium]